MEYTLPGMEVAHFPGRCRMVRSRAKRKEALHADPGGKRMASLSRLRNRGITRTFPLLLAFASMACNLPLLNDLVADEQARDEADAYEYASDESIGIQIRSSTAEEITCDRLDFEPVMDFEIRGIPALDEPPPRSPYHDPVFGTCLIRVSDWPSDFASQGLSAGIKNEYSRVQSFNADESLLLAYSTEGDWYLYDAHSLQPLGRLPLVVEPRWDAEDPDLIYYSDETRLMAHRISTGEQQVVHEFADDFQGEDLAAVWTRYEGSPSIDSRYWGLMAVDQGWATTALLVYDRMMDEVIAMRETPSRPEIDSVTISPLGDYFLAYHDEYCEHGQLGDDAHPCGLMVYDRNLESGRSLLRIAGHSDLALDTQGVEVLVYQDIDQDTISMLELKTGETTALLPIDFTHSAIGFHFSGQAARLPGWILVSTSNGARPSATWMDDQVFAVELKPGGRVVRLAHTHSLYNENIEQDYWEEPHASAGHDLSQIVFTSNWGRSGTDQVDMYLIRLPLNWAASLP
jgi:hypothetical protein